MKKQTLTGWEEFIKYVKEEFGHEIILEESSIPDSFEKIFGGSFFVKNEEIGKIKYVYNGNSASVNFNETINDWESTQEMAFAA